MALGITTNTKEGNINTTVVVQEITSGPLIPGVSPNSDLSLISDFLIPEIITNTNTNPELITSLNVPIFATTTDETPTLATPGFYTRGTDEVKLTNPIYNRVEKLFYDNKTITDIFKAVVVFIRDITNSVIFNSSSIIFSTNKNIEEKNTLAEFIKIDVLFNLVDITSFVDIDVNYNLSTNYSDIANISDFIATKMTFTRNITTSEDTLNVLDTDVIKYANTNVNIISTVADILNNLVNKTSDTSLINSIDVYKNTVIKSAKNYLSIDTNSRLILYKLNTDNLILQEAHQHIWSIFRDFSDIAIVTDDYYGASNIDDDQYATFNKYQRHQLVVLDKSLLTLNIYPFNEIFYNTDILNINIHKLLNNNLVAKNIDISNLTLNKYLNELKNITETTELYVSLIKYDLITSTDNFVKNQGIVITSFTNLIETFSTAATYLREFANLISNISDIKYFNFYKQSNEQLLFQETSVKNISSSLLDNISMLDPYISIAVFNRMFTDLINKVDSVSINYNINKLNTVTHQEYYQSIANFYREISDSKTLFEEKLLLIKSDKVDSLIIQDNNLLTVNKLPNIDIVLQTDSSFTVTDFIRIFQDYAATTDDYYGLSNIDDDQYATFNKGIINYVRFIETVIPVAFTFYNPQAEFYTTQQELNLFINKYLNITTTGILEKTAFEINKYPNTDTLYNYTKLEFIVDIEKNDLVRFIESAEAVLTVVVELLFSNYLFPDDRKSILYRKILIDSKTITEQKIIQANKYLTETIYNYSTLPSFFTNTIKTDTINITETATIASKLSLLDSFYQQSNDFVLIPKKVVINTVPISEYHIYLMTHRIEQILSTNSITDIRVRKNLDDKKFVFDFFKSELNSDMRLYDTVRITDDYYGAANIDDDQYATFTKFYKDNYTVTDYFEYTAFKTFLDSLNQVIALSILNINKVLSEPLLNINDISILEYRKILIDSKTIAEQKIIQANKYLTETIYNYSTLPSFFTNTIKTDTINITETALITQQIDTKLSDSFYQQSNDFVLIPKKVVVDTLTSSEYSIYVMTYRRRTQDILSMNSSSDRKYIRTGKNIQDQKFIFESFQSVISRNIILYDTITLTDDYYGAANIDDDQYATFTKTHRDSYTTSHILKYTAFKTLLDTLNKTTDIKIVNTNKFLSEPLLHITETFTYDKYSGKGIIDQIFTSNSGIINNQNYFASTYVEPGYAGTNTTIGS